MLAALGAMFAKRPDVAAAHFAQVAYGRDEPAHWLIGIDTSAEWTALVPAIEGVLNAVRPSRGVDFLPLDRAETNGLSSALLNYPPFYARTS